MNYLQIIHIFSYMIFWAHWYSSCNTKDLNWNVFTVRDFCWLCPTTLKPIYVGSKAMNKYEEYRINDIRFNMTHCNVHWNCARKYVSPWICWVMWKLGFFFVFFIDSWTWNYGSLTGSKIIFPYVIIYKRTRFFLLVASNAHPRSSWYFTKKIFNSWCYIFFLYLQLEKNILKQNKSISLTIIWSFHSWLELQNDVCKSV